MQIFSDDPTKPYYNGHIHADDCTIAKRSANNTSSFTDSLGQSTFSQQQSYKYNIISYENINGHKLLLDEVSSSVKNEKYSNTQWNGFEQPFQDVQAQYDTYIASGYNDSVDYWETISMNIHVHSGQKRENCSSKEREIQPSSSSPAKNERKYYGFWITCFLAFDMNPKRRRRDSIEFLKLWYEQILFYTTQDQVAFPFVIQALHMFPFSFPDADVSVRGLFEWNTLYHRAPHGE